MSVVKKAWLLVKQANFIPVSLETIDLPISKSKYTIGGTTFEPNGRGGTPRPGCARMPAPCSGRAPISKPLPTPAPPGLSPAAGGSLPAANAAEMLPRRENAVGRKFAQSVFGGGIAIDFTGGRCYNLLVFKITTLAPLAARHCCFDPAVNRALFFWVRKIFLLQEVPR